jgi:hypothetical protein
MRIGIGIKHMHAKALAGLCPKNSGRHPAVPRWLCEVAREQRTGDRHGVGAIRLLPIDKGVDLSPQHPSIGDAGVFMAVVAHAIPPVRPMLTPSGTPGLKRGPAQSADIRRGNSFLLSACPNNTCAIAEQLSRHWSGCGVQPYQLTGLNSGPTMWP